MSVCLCMCVWEALFHITRDTLTLNLSACATYPRHTERRPFIRQADLAAEEEEEGEEEDDEVDVGCLESLSACQPRPN